MQLTLTLTLTLTQVDSTFQSHYTLLQLVHAIYALDHPRLDFHQTLRLMVDTRLFQNEALPLDFDHLAVAFSLSRLQVRALTASALLPTLRVRVWVGVSVRVARLRRTGLSSDHLCQRVGLAV